MNRVLQFLRPECPCCVAKRRYARLKTACEAIEELALGAIEFCVPSVSRLAGETPLFDSEDEDLGTPETPTLRFYINVQADRVSIDSDIRSYAVAELRRIADELIAAADAVEGGVA